MFQTHRGRWVREVVAVVGVHQASVWHLLRKKLKMFHYQLQNGPGPSETNNEIHVFFAQLCKEKLENNPSFMQRIVFSNEYSFSLNDAVDKQNCKIWVPNAQKLFMSHHRDLQI